MRISDWSSDVCSSDLRINSPEGTVYGDKGQYKLDEQVFVMTGDNLRLVSKEDVVTARDSLEYWEGQRKAIARGNAEAIHEDKQIRAEVLTANLQENATGELAEIGRATCRERVGQYV